MQKYHKNGQGDSDIVETSEPFTYTPAELNRRSQGEPKGPCPQIFRKYSHFVVLEAFSIQISVSRLK